MKQAARFLTTGDGVTLAWAATGRGPALVKAANWLTDLEYDWESPVWRHWTEFLAAHFRYIRYDERGCGLAYVAGAVTLDESAFGSLIGLPFVHCVEGAAQPDLPTAIDALRAFLRDCAEKPIPPDDFERALAFNAIVPPEVRSALAARTIDSDDVLERMSVPVLAVHGTADRIVLPAMTEHILGTCPTATGSWYEGVGHMPFMEEPGRFNEELAGFVRGVQQATLTRIVRCTTQGVCCRLPERSDSAV